MADIALKLAILSLNGCARVEASLGVRETVRSSDRIIVVYLFQSGRSQRAGWQRFSAAYHLVVISSCSISPFRAHPCSFVMMSAQFMRSPCCDLKFRWKNIRFTVILGVHLQLHGLSLGSAHPQCPPISGSEFP